MALGFLFVSLGLNSLLAFPAIILGTVLLTSRREMTRRAEIAALAFLEVALVLFFVPGFLFTGGGFPRSAAVAVTSVSCDPSTLICTGTLVNTGNSDASAVDCTLTYEGVSYAGVVRGNGAQTVPAGGQALTLCDLSSASSLRPSAGSNFTGFFTTSNGATIPFAGAWP
jgi:hypothetical protein